MGLRYRQWYTDSKSYYLFSVIFYFLGETKFVSLFYGNAQPKMFKNSVEIGRFRNFGRMSIFLWEKKNYLSFASSPRYYSRCSICLSWNEQNFIENVSAQIQKDSLRESHTESNTQHCIMTARTATTMFMRWNVKWNWIGMRLQRQLGFAEPNERTELHTLLIFVCHSKVFVCVWVCCVVFA